MGLLATAVVDIVPNLGPLDSGLAQAKGRISSFVRSQSDAKVLIGVGIAGAGLAALGGLSRVLLDSAKKAAAFNEIMNKVKVTFGAKAATGLVSQANDLADKFGLMRGETLRAAADFGLFGRAAGMSQEESAGFAKELVQLGADLASFHKTTRGEAFAKLESGLAGMARPLRSLGIFLSEDAVKARALAMGIGSIGKELTEQEKIRARFSLIMEQAGPARGDLARTADSAHNQMLKFQGDIQNAIGAIGKEFVPALVEAIKTARELGKALSEEFSKTGVTVGKLGEDVKTTIENWGAAVKLFRVLRNPETAKLIAKHGVLGGITEAVFQLDKTPGGGKGLPATLPDVLAKQREMQEAGTMADIAAAIKRSAGPSLEEQAETEINELNADKKHEEDRKRTLNDHMKRIQADQDSALAESLGGVALGPLGAAAIERDKANRILARMMVGAPGALNLMRNVMGGPIAPLMGAGRGGQALATGLERVFGGPKPPEVQAYQDQIDSLKGDLNREKLLKTAREKLGIIDQPSTMFANPAEFARSAIQGILGPTNDQVKAIEESIKVLEQIRDKLPGQEKLEPRRRGIFPIG